MATAARLLTHAAGYASQWHEMRTRRNRILVRVVEGSSDVAAAVRLCMLGWWVMGRWWVAGGELVGGEWEVVGG